ncbi:hypothetical protein N7474_004302 [Penicillium riverlandense]|uniref:uncharacterized protein n=1 Tax=Penicillium riverlandense TaxID=1903569 RepID=UPI002546D8B0|nr:uncharacterized protein N7474_004302 [Penicillium riverlandense]KAJ5818711.1 hypothetical protein N7474_004302 [Penicillium riverlandense]
MNEQTFIPPSMRALYYTIHLPIPATADEEPGEALLTGPGRLVMDTGFPTPQPSAQQYLLKIQTAAFCHDELRLARTLSPTTTTPQIPLHSLCGTVISTPAADHEQQSGPRFKIGDVVFGLISYIRDGGAADYALAVEDELAFKPQNISASEAAAVALPALTAWQALFRYAGLNPDATGDGISHDKKGNSNHSNGDGKNGNGNGHGLFKKVSGNGNGHGKKVPPLRVLVTNARDNEVGRLAVQLLRTDKLFPVRPWICVSCTATEADIVQREWDVDEVLVIPHLPARNECDLAAMFRQRRWEAVDVVLDCAGGEVYRQAHEAAVVRNYGAVLTAVDSRPAQQAVPPERGLRSKLVAVAPDGVAMMRIGALIEEGRVRGVPETVVDLVNSADLLASGAAGTAGSRRGGMMVVRVN